MTKKGGMGPLAMTAMSNPKGSAMIIGFIFMIILSCICCSFSMVFSSMGGFGYNNYDGDKKTMDMSFFR